jgi:MoxR-like ATPase
VWPLVSDAVPLHDAQPERLNALVEMVETVFHGKRDVVRLAVAALLARGHILFEDIPGVGKTTLARALASTSGLSFRRIQFTSDLLPSDVLGVSVYNPQTATFETRTGPIFTNIVVADEINRAPPRTQSGLLEAMQENRVTIDERTHELPRPFLVMATQNPLEHHGTYPLPESQLDRFLIRLTIGYPDAKAERRILLESVGTDDPVESLESVLTPAEVLSLQQKVENVHADPVLLDYLTQIVRATRADNRLRMGASPRASVGLFRIARAHALLNNRAFIIPDDIQAMVVPCLAHRLLPVAATTASAEAHDQAASLLEGILSDIPVPV